MIRTLECIQGYRHTVQLADVYTIGHAHHPYFVRALPRIARLSRVSPHVPRRRLKRHGGKKKAAAPHSQDR